jgi:hypothetical protein
MLDRIFALIAFCWLSGLTLFTFTIPDSAGYIEKVAAACMGAAIGIGALTALYFAITGKEL